MKHLAQAIPIDFANAGDTAEIYQLGKPHTAVSAITTPHIYLEGDALSLTLNILIAGDATTAGTIYVEACNDIVPTIGITPEFVPIGWAPVLGGSLSVAGNGTYLSAAIPIPYNLARIIWAPTAGSAGTIQGTALWQGRP